MIPVCVPEFRIYQVVAGWYRNLGMNTIERNIVSTDELIMSEQSRL